MIKLLHWRESIKVNYHKRKTECTLCGSHLCV